MRKINVADVTLKKLSEDRAVSLLFREKSAIANCADRLMEEGYVQKDFLHDWSDYSSYLKSTEPSKGRTIALSMMVPYLP